jgi:nitrile hydratase
MSERSPQSIRAEALEALLIEKGFLKVEDVDDVIARYSERVGPLNGAQVVARAWIDKRFRDELLRDGSAAVSPYQFEGGQVEKLVVVANTPAIHNVVVCTLCSCYPWALLGLPPKWYKDPEYRSRIVREPRKVIGEMGFEVAAGKSIKVWDSSAEIRYLVLPEPPENLLQYDENELPGLVSRDGMIGVAER